MKHYLLDTNICAFLLRQRYDIEKHIQRVGWNYGAENSNNPEQNMQTTNSFCERIHIIPIGEIARQYAVEKVKLRRKGMLIDDFDLLIATTALEKNLILVTENIRHMDRIPGIKIENWVVR
jgi:tRNA(fMet)-specific endonuclease VapC